MYDYVIYHKNCIDGFSGFFLLYLSKQMSKDSYIYPDIPSTTSVPKRIENRNIIIIDVAYKTEIIEAIFKKANSVVFIDHHDSIKNSMKELQIKYKNSPTKRIIFDTKYSGVGLTWRFLYPKKPFPRFVKYIQDNDTGTWEYSDTINFINALQVKYELIPNNENLTKWKKLFKSSEIDNLISIGKIYDEYKNYIMTHNGRRYSLLHFPSQKLLDLKPELKTKMKAKQFTIAVTNNTCPNVSMLGNYLMKNVKCDFAMLWTLNIDRKEYVISLRSLEDDTHSDVGLIASYFGGGGHKGASAFSISANDINIVDMFS